MGSKVYLAPVDKRHLFRYMRLSDDPELIRTMGWYPFQQDEIERFVNALDTPTLPCCNDGPPLTVSIMTRSGDLPIGYVTFKGIDYDNAAAELAIAIMDRRYRSRGYGSDAISLAADHAFHTMHLRVLGLTVFPANVRAIRAYEKFGFKVVDLLEKAWTMPGGEKVDMLLMELHKHAG